MAHTQWTTSEEFARHKRRFQDSFPIIVLVDMWKCSQCSYTEVRDIPPNDGTDHSTATPHLFTKRQIAQNAYVLVIVLTTRTLHLWNRVYL